MSINNPEDSIIDQRETEITTKAPSMDEPEALTLEVIKEIEKRRARAHAISAQNEAQEGKNGANKIRRSRQRSDGTVGSRTKR